jgi:hypothetical protein
MTHAVTVLESSEQGILNKINERLQQEKGQGAHILAPLTLQTIPAMHRPVVVSVQIDPDPKNKEVYPQRGGGLTLSAIAFKKLGDAMGIQWVEEECGRLDDGTDPDYVHYRMTGLIKALDGTWRKILGDKEIRMSVIIEELTDNNREKAKAYLEDPKDGPEFRRAHPDPEVWIREKVRQEALQIKKHLLSRAQTGALARATKSIGIRETYTAAELQKPFVFPKLVFSPDPNHPQDRAFLLAQGAGAMNQLYKVEQPATAAQPSLLAVPAAHVPRDVAFLMPPDDPEEQTSTPTKDEALRADFLAGNPKEQAEVLTHLIRWKGWTTKIDGDPAKWTAGDRMKFFDVLMARSDVEETGAAKLPF